MKIGRGVVFAVCTAALALALVGGAYAGKDAPQDVDQLLQRAQANLASAGADARVAGLKDLEAATKLAPERADVWMAYGRACRETGRSSKARSCFTRAAELAPDDPAVWSDLGAEWKNDWLLTTDRESLDEALRCYAQATTLAPDSSGPWCAASALLLLQGRPQDAYRAALKARRADLAGFEPLLVLAASFYRLSVVAYADSAFRMARARMPAELRQRLDDDSPLRPFAVDTDTSNPKDGEPWLWRDADPDLTTPENEALLDYRTRVTLAFFLFRDRDALRWDARADLFVRFGPPDAIDYNGPAGWDTELEITYVRQKELTHETQIDYGPGPHRYTFNRQVWKYASLGINVALYDFRLTHTYELTPSLERDRYDPRAKADSLDSREELVRLGAGRGVFRALAPGVTPMQVEGTISRFVVGDSTLVQAHVAAAGGTADSMVGAWAIVASDGTVLKRETAQLSLSACDPSAERVATFAMTAPPGEFRIDLAVSARGGRRGVVRLRSNVEPVPPGLAMSDLVLVCGDASLATSYDAVRIEPNLSRRVANSKTVTAYYELDHLVTAPNGETRFSFRYTIRRAAQSDDEAPGRVLIDASREERSTGTHRRQFVSANIASLPSGRYELQVEVRDLIGGSTASGTTEFVKARH
ncbi:MAG: tetratricopeptide repeat protein [Candidatus Eisenbacteria bacterium]|nr:tetratricopeptide repeat protein [Candidatus Eisenbacteria bacterium]